MNNWNRRAAACVLLAATEFVCLPLPSVAQSLIELTVTAAPTEETPSNATATVRSLLPGTHIQTKCIDGADATTGTCTVGVDTKDLPTLSGTNVITGITSYAASAQQNLNASSTIACNATRVAVSAAAPVTLTATPTIAGAAQDGQICIVQNTGAYDITMTSGATTRLKLSSPTVTLKKGERLTLMWDMANAVWTSETGSAASESGYTTVRDVTGSPQLKRSSLRFLSGFTLGDDSASTTVSLDTTAVATMDALQSGSWSYAVAAGSTDTYAACPIKPIGALSDGMRVLVKVNTSNTGAATFNLCSLGDKKLLLNGAALNYDGTLIGGHQYLLAYNSMADGGSGAWSVMGGASVASASSTGPAPAGSEGDLQKRSGTGFAAAVPGIDYVLPAGNVATATALAGNGANCPDGQYPAGVDAKGNAENCTAIATPALGVGILSINGDAAAAQTITAAKDNSLRLSTAGGVTTVSGPSDYRARWCNVVDTEICEWESFLSGEGGTRFTGSMGWNWAGGSLTWMPAENTPEGAGVIRRHTSVTANTMTFIQPQSVSRSGFHNLSNFDVICGVRLNEGNATDTAVRIGLSGNAANSGSQPTDGVYVEKVGAMASGWNAVARAGSVESKVTTNVAVGTSSQVQWVRVRRVNGSTVGFSVNSTFADALAGSGEVTLSTSLPTVGLNGPWVAISNPGVAASRSIDIFACGLAVRQ